MYMIGGNRVPRDPCPSSQRSPDYSVGRYDMLVRFGDGGSSGRQRDVAGSVVVDFAVPLAYVTCCPS